ncbi:hypothetical protein HanPI659440_Chr08g0280071 [Helianthus annuus]|nr:hypothetical protein HanPI659440_Chr08g0280071 [Helianthus annuus]
MNTNIKSCSVSVHQPFVNTFIFLTNEHEQDLVRVRSVRNNNSTDHLVVNFTNTPFTYSTTATRFTAIGCNNLALISGPIRVLGGCVSLCTDTTPDNNCYGVLCCQTNIPPSLKFINASLSSIESRYGNGPCKYAFMVDVAWFGNLIDIYVVQSMPSVPAVLDWRLSANCNAFGPLDLGTNTSVCDSRAFCSNQSVCACSRGYQGNPYLSGGCQGKSLKTSKLTSQVAVKVNL